MPKLVDHTPAQITTALTVLAGCAEDYNLANEMLKDQGLNSVGTDLLRKWRRQNAAEYNQIVKDTGDQFRGVLIDQMTSRAVRATEVALLAIEKAESRLRQNQDSNPAKTAEALAKVADTNIAKAQLLRGEPTEIKESRSVPELLKWLEAKKVLTIDEPKQ